uniref:60S acidic ribosomal protein P2 n=1 Tax=Cryptomonas curvata TaxID=233186 RepID=A0A7S0QEY1_9CRYP|mmetsp:Transcript_18712/g.39419  ORF Transcript_18712/g.39419 Transcript_18712/m.39419 type:complete len:112 (-) Transcript_18712:45-380(-)|eukprot:CAMPEP_0172185310 /NCGR_PEP_ID=MMETSP1050-20130122/20094_1 /TAXON_ID=233186 /ORGANISM="Cryptomonas curvata, Strain CCAP979/52" /LENGTH=111 /DNA_ID=CAMNT_0012859273 /DNA_START=34 /DNA_END=369 /DNA_ORIENTATION=-
MKHVAAYLLAVLGGKTDPTEADVKAILRSVDAKVDDAALAKVMSELKGKDLEALIAEGSKKIASAAVSAGPAAGGAPAAAAAPAAGGGKKEEAKKAPEPEEEEDMGFSLFD